MNVFSNAALPPELSLRRSDEVSFAQEIGQAVVALESTVITHGLSYPDNVRTALDVEAVIRSHGAVPATIAVVDGVVRIGLSADEIEELSRAKDVLKTSRRDLPVVVARGGTGATTVAATMICAQLAGIRVFVTGGIGGVHRGAEASMDVSADLTELARTEVAVVCAGAKSILDLGLTLEVLETLGVPVIGYGTDRFPAFYTRDSGLELACRADTPEAVAAILKAQSVLGLAQGAVIANPIPEAMALPAEEMAAAIKEALAAAAAEGVSGKALTPYLLARLAQTTAGRSSRANMALLRHNAAVGAQIALALAALA